MLNDLFMIKIKFFIKENKFRLYICCQVQFLERKSEKKKTVSEVKKIEIDASLDERQKHTRLIPGFIQAIQAGEF